MAFRSAAKLPAPGCARWGASGSLYPQSAIAGPNAAEGVTTLGLGPTHVVLTVRFRALRELESGQIRKEAALSAPFQVPRFGLTRASDVGSSRGDRNNGGPAWPGTALSVSPSS